MTCIHFHKNALGYYCDKKCVCSDSLCSVSMEKYNGSYRKFVYRPVGNHIERRLSTIDSKIHITNVQLKINFDYEKDKQANHQVNSRVH